MASKNRVCLTCGVNFHECSSCGDTPGWGWTYCSSECWSSSQRAIMCLALGNKLAGLLEPHELAILKVGIDEEPHWLDKVLEGLLLPRG